MAEVVKAKEEEGDDAGGIEKGTEEIVKEIPETKSKSKS